MKRNVGGPAGPAPSTAQRSGRVAVTLPILLLLFQVIFGCAALLQGRLPVTEKDFQIARQRMVAEQLKSRDINDRRVLEAMGKVERHRFVPESVRPYAYEDYPLSIGEKQTISQPYIVALMTQVARPAPQDRALEVGTGSGYQAAILSELLSEVYTVEIVETLGQRAGQILLELGYDNVHVRVGDGYEGWPEEAPFDVILVTAAAKKIPEPLIEQLAEGGRLVIPVGDFRLVQRLILVHKQDGKIKKSTITSVRFVPMTGKIEQKR